MWISANRLTDHSTLLTSQSVWKPRGENTWWMGVISSITLHLPSLPAFLIASCIPLKSARYIGGLHSRLCLRVSGEGKQGHLCSGGNGGFRYIIITNFRFCLLLSLLYLLCVAQAIIIVVKVAQRTSKRMPFYTKQIATQLRFVSLDYVLRSIWSLG